MVKTNLFLDFFYHERLIILELIIFLRLGHVIANAASSEKPPCYDNIYYPPEDNADPLPQRADVI